MLEEDPNKRITAKEIINTPEIEALPPTWMIAEGITEPSADMFWEE
jgi:hypothetical protein